MIKKPLFSIVTVVFNDAENLEKTIQSVIGQTFKDFEYIVIDGGSKDHSPAVIKKYESFITYSVSEPDYGIYDAMNKGIQAAKGHYINFLNAGDSYFSPDTLQILSDRMNDLAIEIYYGQAVRKSSETSTLRFTKGGKITSFNLFTSIPFCHQGLFYQTSLFSEIGLYDCRFKVTADYQWLIRYFNARLQLEKTTFVNENLVEYAEGGYSFKNIRKAAKEKLKIALHYFKGYYRIVGLVFFSFFYLKSLAIQGLDKLRVLESYREIKYRILKRAVS